MNPTSKKTSHALGAEHGMSRRLFMNSLAVSLAGTGGLVGNAGSAHLFDQVPLQKELKAKGRSVILVWLAGGASQFETWDPKPGRATGGPFGTLPTSVPGVHFSEAVPHLAKVMDKVSIIRSICHKDPNHGGGNHYMMTGAPTPVPVSCGAFVPFPPSFGSMISYDRGKCAQTRIRLRPLSG